MKKTVKKTMIFAMSLALAGSVGLGSALYSADAAIADVTQDGNYVGRTFNADYDEMLEDFAAAQPQDETTEAIYASDGVLSVTYTGGENSDDVDAAIYKIGSSTVSATTPWPYTHLVIEMSSPDGSATLSELAIHLRELGDASVTDAISFDADLLDPTSAKEIGTEKTKIAIDMQTYVTNAELTSLVNNGIAGYHLVAKTGETGTVMIHDVYLANLNDDEIPDFGAQGTRTLADFENGTKVDQKVDDGIYWCGSEVGIIIPKHVQLTDDTYTLPAGKEGYSSIALTVRGEGSISVGGKAWSELKGPDGNAVPAITTSFATYVIDLEASGIGASNTAITLVSTGAVDVQNAFLTNMEVADPEIQQIPFIDTATANKIDDFAYANKVALGGDYDAAIGDAANADAGVQYRLSYANANKVTIADGALIFDATELESSGYINFKTQSVKNIVGYKYFVLKMKAEDGATLDGFRFGLGVDGTAAPIIWGNGGLKSDTNLVIPALGGLNPYTTADGWEYIVVDLAASGLSCGNTVDMYYSGVGKLYVDEMFYCNGLDRGIKMEVTPFDANAEIVVETTGYEYNYIGGGAAGRYLAFEAKGEDGATLDEFRFTFDGVSGTYWLGKNAEGTAVGMDGQLLPALTEEYQTYIIDLEKSGMKDWANIEHVHLHAALGAGKVTIKGAGFATYDIVEANTVNFITEESNYEISGAGSYQYIAGFPVTGNVGFNRYLAITVKGTEGIMDDEIRLQFIDGATELGIMYWKDNKNLLVDPNGAALAPITADYQTFYIDLDAIGVPRDFTYLHIHSTSNTAATLSIKSIGFATADAINYANIVMPKFDSVKPTVEVTTAATAKVGDTITVAYTASDNVTAAKDLTVEISVTFNGTPVELTDNSFVASEGAYVITVTVSDEEGNVKADSVTVTVTNGGSNPSESNGTQSGGDKTSNGCGGSIASAGVIGALMLMGAACFIVRKKEDK